MNAGQNVMQPIISHHRPSTRAALPLAVCVTTAGPYKITIDEQLRRVQTGDHEGDRCPDNQSNGLSQFNEAHKRGRSTSSSESTICLAALTFHRQTIIPTTTLSSSRS